MALTVRSITRRDFIERQVAMTDQQPAPLSPAERSRRYRERKRDNVYLVTIEVDEALLDGLVSYNFVLKEERQDREGIEDGLAILMKAVTDRGIGLRAEWIEQIGNTEPRPRDV